jgi:hypothetical protein
LLLVGMTYVKLEKIFLIGQSQTRIAYCSYISLCQIVTKYGNFVQDFTYVIPTSNNLLCLLVSEEKIFQISTNQKQEFPMAIMFMYTLISSNLFTNIAAIGNSCLWLVDF